MNTPKYRAHELNLTKRVGITEETHLKLKELRKLLKMSMARIVDTLINNKYNEK
jgi:hypothetical protein